MGSIDEALGQYPQGFHKGVGVMAASEFVSVQL